MSAGAERAESQDDPLAVRVGPWAGADDIPADGWPDEADPAVVQRILDLLPND